MPTGYTAPVADGEITELSEFAATIAPAFGAFAHQRDDFSGTLRYPPRPDENHYVWQGLLHAEDKRFCWEQSSEEEKYAQWSEYVNERQRLCEGLNKGVAETRARYEAMLDKVRSVPVDSRLDNFKEFMINQLADSIRFDCHVYSLDTLSYSEWCDAQDEKMYKDISYYREQWAEVLDLHAESVRFISLLSQTYGITVEKS